MINITSTSKKGKEPHSRFSLHTRGVDCMRSSKTSHVALIGFGHVGQAAMEALLEAPDMELAGIVIKDSKERAETAMRLSEIPIVENIETLSGIDTALLATPSRFMPKLAEETLSLGINTVDCYDIHGESLLELRKKLDPLAKQKGRVAIISAGWDPGTDSIVRALSEIITPRGLTYTNFGPGMSMGHTVAAKAIEGVEDALALTIPLGFGVHRRMVYLNVKKGHDFEAVTKKIKEDPYFNHDETYFFQCDNIQNLIDEGHSVHIERKGVAGKTPNQRMQFAMSVSNPSATGQVLVSAARAAMLQKPGCYSLIEIPVIDFLYGDREGLIERLV